MKTLLEITLEASHLAVREAAARLRSVLGGVVESGHVDRLELAFVEACTNSVRYGVPRGGRSPVRVTLTRSREALELTIEDLGPPFHLAGLVAPKVDPARIDALPTRGRGLALIRDLSDGAHIERIEDGNRMILRFDIAPSSPRTPVETAVRRPRGHV